MLLSFVVVVMVITFYQEQRSERALEALRDLSSPRALVVREGRQKRIAGRDVVRGDLLVLAEGDRVPADAALVFCINLSVDESTLTGESMPVRKTAADAFEAKVLVVLIDVYEKMTGEKAPAGQAPPGEAASIDSPTNVQQPDLPTKEVHNPADAPKCVLDVL